LLKKRDRKPAADPSIYPSFRMPRLILDLDAETSGAYVRSATREDEEQQRLFWGRSRILDVAQRMDAFQNELARTDEAIRISKAQLSPWSVMQRDVLSVALFRAPSAAATQMAREKQVLGRENPEARRLEREGFDVERDEEVARVLKFNGVPARAVWDEQDTFQYLLHAMERSSKVTLGTDAARLFEQALGGCSSVAEVGRLLTNVLDTPGGQMLIAQNGNLVVATFGRMAEHGREAEIKSSDILKLLNHLAIRVEAQGGDLGQDLCLYALRLSAEALQLGALQRHTELGKAKGFIGGPGDQTALTVFPVFETLFDSVNFRLSDLGDQAPVSRPHLFASLTGGSTTLTGCTGHQSRSLRTAIGSAAVYRRAFTRYIIMVGGLGGLRTLWHEWQSNSGYEAPDKHMAPVTKAVTYTNALQRLTMQIRLRGISKEQLGQYYSQASGVYEEDLCLDMQAIAEIDRVAPAQPEQTGQPRTPLKVQQPVAAVKEALSDPDAQAALTKLVHFVIGGV
jgi:hypothetical protein